MKSLITIIIPVYNASEYLSRCLDSILRQTFTEWQLILVDDGSRDNSLHIMQEYAEKDSRINVFHKANEGVSIARQYGLDRVGTPYFIFCDADDYVEPDYLEKLYEAIKKNNSDIAVCKYVEEYEDGVIERELPVTDYIGFVRNLLVLRIWGVTWNKLYKTSIVREQHLTFPKYLQMWEDLAFTVRYCMFAESVAFVEKPLYHYVKVNTDSITSHEQIKYNFNRVEAIRYFEETMHETGKENLYQYEMLWIKYHIKDHFLSSVISNERIIAWHNSFSEVNDEWRKVGNNNFLHFILTYHMACVLYIPYWYRKMRFNIHKWIKRIGK